MVVEDQVRSTQIEQNQMELDRYPEMKRILEVYSEIESKPSDDRVGSTQIEQSQRELDRYPATKRIRKIESKPSDDRVGSTKIVQYQRGTVRLFYEELRRRLIDEYREIKSNPSDDFDCRMRERNPYEWQFGIRGASGTEFEGGIYHGMIQFPEEYEYPSKPPTENGRFKTHNKIRIRRLNDWQPSWGVRDGLLALIDEMPTYPDGELGSVEYNKEERRDLAIKSRAAAPKFGTSERQKLIDEIHKYLLSKSPPVPVPHQHEHSQNDGAKRKHGGGGGGSVVNNNFIIRNRIHATNSNGVGFLDSMNEAFNEGPNPKKPKLSWFWWRN